MSETITPQEAFFAAKLLWGAREIFKHDNAKVLMYRERGDLLIKNIDHKIDWPKGVEVWPQPKKEWVELNPLCWKDFHGKGVQVEIEDNDWVECELVGFSDGDFLVIHGGDVYARSCVKVLK
jgi:hypothetical protein